MSQPKRTSDILIAAELIQGFGVGEDGVHLYGGEARQCFVKPNPNIPLDSPHLDGFQLIDKSSNNEQYALGFMKYFSINNCVVDGLTTPIQCAFAADGVFGYGEIEDNTFKTDGHHFISINGLLTGSVTGNRCIGTHADDYPIKFKPARVGGNPDSLFNVWILHWKDDYYQYGTIDCDTPDLVQDLRQSVFNTTDKFLINFDQAKFDQRKPFISATGGRAMGRALQRIALECGDLITEFTPRESVIMNTQTMKASKEILAFIGNKENARGLLHLHKDPAGLDTIGYGHLLTSAELAEGVIYIADEPFDFRRTDLTPQQMQTLFMQDIEPREFKLNALLENISVNQNQFDALLSFAYNIGLEAFEGSTAYRKLQAGDFNAVPAAMKLWNKMTVDRGMPTQRLVVSKGLTIRRKEEAAWFESEPTVIEASRFPAPPEPVTINPSPGQNTGEDSVYFEDEAMSATEEPIELKPADQVDDALLGPVPTKPFFQSKILATVVAMLIGALTVTFGDIDPALKELITNVVMWGGPALIAVLRKWFTNTVLK